MSELDPQLRRAFATARGERPDTDEGKSRTLAALGVGVASATATSSASASSVGLRLVGLLGWRGWSAVVVIAAGISIATLSSSHEEKETSTLSSPTVPIPAATIAPVVVPVMAPVEASPAFSIADLPNAAPDSPRVDRTPKGPRVAFNAAPETAREAPLQEGSSLREEIDALERARRALSDRHCAQARRALSDYRSRFPNGRLEREADVVDVEITGRSGDVAHARAAAHRFVSRFPDSPYAMRLTPWLGDEGSEINVTSCTDMTRP
ncbi:hypothetical protein AKJ09_01479 [Labilithrix luteola]|uniref:Uncharacterized protein n=1 Tax=Labilithrix luteola TaxID=1391654 RepID=A0A0K1PMQ5_9BACT|nr:outer membrane protein assembly factor BamD [Labilithrix luteola]AKU94815.1 hypothetical protein AKJ09_01479 [Labilithrix luteola]